MLAESSCQHTESQPTWASLAVIELWLQAQRDCEDAYALHELPKVLQLPRKALTGLQAGCLQASQLVEISHCRAMEACLQGNGGQAKRSIHAQVEAVGVPCTQSACRHAQA